MSDLCLSLLYTNSTHRHTDDDADDDLLAKHKDERKTHLSRRGHEISLPCGFTCLKHVKTPGMIGKALEPSAYNCIHIHVC